ncbi:MAG TPA: pyridoxal phosphate-dependent aminotransferase [Bryobacteraceae bacterium]|nr:pyridoxal phosphate-dependent aminotransferase [Bryobacteraceae bacterium]
MFSSRLNWDLRPNRISALLDARRRGGARILDLTESNPTHAGLAYPSAEILAALGDARSLRYEPSPTGVAEARGAVSAYYAARGASVAPDRIVLTASTSEAYGYVFKLLADPGDEVLVPRPSYPLFEFLARLESVRAVDYPLAYDGSWRIDFAALEGALTPRTRAIVVVNPNNPTGSFLKTGELDRLVSLAAARGFAIVSDEVFSDYAFAPDAERVTTLAGVSGALAFSLSGLSKIAGLPQMKLGWIVTSGPEELRAAALARLELIADTYLSASAPAQYGAARLMEAGARVREQISARTRQNLEWVRDAVAGSALSVLAVEGGWYATLEVPRTRSEEEWALELLDLDGVLVQPGFFFDFETEAFLVVSLLTPPDVFREGVGRVLGRAGE